MNNNTPILPSGWNPKVAGEKVLNRLINVCPPQVKGAHDADFTCIGDFAYIVSMANDIQPSHNTGWAFIYVTMAVVDLKTLAVQDKIELARSEQKFDNETLPIGACFVPRILQKDADTLRCFFASEQPSQRQSQMWYRDFNLDSRQFAPTIHKAKLKTATGTFDFQPQFFYEDAAAQGFTKPANAAGLYLIDGLKTFDEKVYAVINNYPGKQNGLAMLHDDYATFEVLSHFNEPQSQQLCEASVNRLPDGTWMAICRNDSGNYHFTTSADARSWTVGTEMSFVPNGTSSKPTFDKFGDTYYLGWQEDTKIQGAFRSVFNVDISRDGKTWERKYHFESPESFHYPTFKEHERVIWLTVTQRSSADSRTERIMFGKLE